MTECYKCGISKEKATLYEGVSPAGIVNVCRKCFFIQKMPLLERKKVDWSEIDQIRTVRQRLSRMSGFKEKAEEKAYVPTQKDQELRSLVEKNFEENALGPTEVPEDLIPNFNWIIMRKRRALKLSLKDFADRIYVPESIADSIERGVLPRDYKSLIRKVEISLDVNLFSEKKFKIKPEDLATEAKVPSGALMSEVEDTFVPVRDDELFNNNSKIAFDETPESLTSLPKEEGGFTDTYEIDASELNLDNVEDMFGTPEPTPKPTFREVLEETKLLSDETTKSEPKKELSDEDVKRFAWGN